MMRSIVRTLFGASNPRELQQAKPEPIETAKIGFHYARDLYNVVTHEASYSPASETTVRPRDFSSHNKVVCSETFQVAMKQDAEIQVPSAESLEQAGPLTERRDLAWKLQELISESMKIPVGKVPPSADQERRR